MATCPMCHIYQLILSVNEIKPGAMHKSPGFLSYGWRKPDAKWHPTIIISPVMCMFISLPYNLLQFLWSELAVVYPLKILSLRLWREIKKNQVTSISFLLLWFTILHNTKYIIGSHLDLAYQFTSSCTSPAINLQ